MLGLTEFLFWKFIAIVQIMNQSINQKMTMFWNDKECVLTEVKDL